MFYPNQNLLEGYNLQTTKVYCNETSYRNSRHCYKHHDTHSNKNNNND